MFEFLELGDWFVATANNLKARSYSQGPGDKPVSIQPHQWCHSAVWFMFARLLNFAMSKVLAYKGLLSYSRLLEGEEYTLGMDSMYGIVGTILANKGVLKH